jgi:hypothetical protein
MSTTTTTAHSKVYNRLLDEVGIGVSPSPSPSPTPSPLINIYPYHAVANLVLDAITVEPMSNIPVTSDSGFGTGQFIENHEIRISVRVHTSYAGGIEQLDATLELVDEVITAIKSNIDFGDRYILMGFASEGINIEFAESRSVGAEIIVIIHKVEGYP